ncbi:ankyrin-1 isoform X1 [Manihot esculenta]|uniref:Serine/threonine-protein kinase BSK1-like TPR repeats domain-containing protein n=1 Tax=Manihot esculenta TaxID=3983 RepID=A0A2C9VI16_MANES|nr:ankyrin-1 isoform X1 [Manihot esculenta]
MAPDASDALAVRQKVQQFLTAARTGNLDLLKNVAAQLDDGRGIAKAVADIKDANKRGALHFAAREGQTEVCKFLVEDLKLDVDTKDEDGDTPLLHAARQGHTATAKYLIEHGANPSIPSDLGATPLHHSAGIGNIELLRYLLSKGVEVDSESDAGTPLIWAAGHAQPDALKVLLEHHANPNSETEDNITPLLSAVAAGSLACLESLVQAGANVNVIAGGATPLHIAADNGSPEILKCLLKAGADPNVTDEDGQKPIQVAATRGNLAAVEILFPVTSKVQAIPEWTIDGILRYMQSETNKQMEEMRNPRELIDTEGTAVPKKDLPEVSPEAKRRAAEAKSRGDEAFRRREYRMAVDAYTQAIDLDPTNATLLSNRSLCWVRLGQPEHALTDAKACRALRPDWSKACYREGAALRLLQRFDEAANSFYEGVMLDPDNKELVSAFRIFRRSRLLVEGVSQRVFTSWISNYLDLLDLWEAVEAGRKFHGTDEKKS